MREILFRGKALASGDWVYGDYITIYDSPRYKAISTRGIETKRRIYEVDPATVGQYTGMTDKNEVKIFEGDIVLKRTYNGKRAFPVTFTDGMFHAGWGGGSSTATHAYTLDDRQIEVIGNRWDNPELLKEAQK